MKGLKALTIDHIFNISLEGPMSLVLLSSQSHSHSQVWTAPRAALFTALFSQCCKRQLEQGGIEGGERAEQLAVKWVEQNMYEYYQAKVTAWKSKYLLLREKVLVVVRSGCWGF